MCDAPDIARPPVFPGAPACAFSSATGLLIRQEARLVSASFQDHGLNPADPHHLSGFLDRAGDVVVQQIYKTIHGRRLG
jgi:hypothetical protein